MKHISLIYYFVITQYILLIPIFSHAQSGNSPVIVQKNKEGYYHITNGLLGIVVPTEEIIRKNYKQVLAPIQSFIYKDGSYSDDTRNYLNLEAPPQKINVKLTSSKDSVKVIVNYLFNKPKFAYYDGNYKGGDAGPGYYTCIITVRKGAKSITIEEDCDYDFFYEVKISNGLNPDQARYRGWISFSPEEGFEKNNLTYRDESQRGSPADATVTLSLDKFRLFPYLSLWDPAGGEINTGRYWQVYNKASTSKDNLFGFFQGRTSRLIGGSNVGVRLVQNLHAQRGRVDTVKDKSHFALGIESFRRGPDNVWYPRKRFEWCAFISQKSDLLPPEQFQPIGREMNRVSGLASRIEGYANKKMKISPSVQDLSLYMPAQNIQAIIQRVKTDESFYNYLINLDMYFKYILDAWRFPDSVKPARQSILQYYTDLKKKYILEDGIHSFDIKYWKGSFNFKKKAIQISCLLADKSIKIPQEEKDKFNELLRLMARIQWDNDNMPFFESSGINFGAPNMYYQYKNNGRNFFALLFAKDPEFSERARKILNETRTDLLGVISENGMSFGTPHYIQATIDPILFMMLQLKQAGVADLFKEEKTRLLKFIDFYSSLMTPPSVRFSNYRKLISFGDGSEESAVTFGLLGAGFQHIDSELSSRLYHIFENGGRRMSLFGEIIISVDLFNHTGNFRTGSSNYQGYLSHFRSGLNTPYESAAWVLNGERYFDHRNQDRGETSIYALKAPLSLSRSSFYYPHAPDARIRSLVIPESLFPGWKGKDQPIKGEDGKGDPWLLSDQHAFAKLKFSTTSVSRMENQKTHWTRKFALIAVHPDEPLFIYYDSINNNAPNIWNMLFMSEGSIETPTGMIRPIDRINNNENLKQLPESNGEITLAKQWQSFAFTGQTWPLHPTNGINWKMHVYSPTVTGFSLSQWTNTYQNSQEKEEFVASNKKNYSETQQIFRWKSNKPFFAVIVPSLKSKEQIIKSGSNIYNSQIEFTGAKGVYRISPTQFSYQEKNGINIYTAFTTSKTVFPGLTIQGGITEIEMSSNQLIIRLHGPGGKRKIEFAGILNSAEKSQSVLLQHSGGKSLVTIDYQNKTIDLTSDKVGFIEYRFAIK